jgi:hypothetical protein
MASCYINSLILFFHITQLELGFAKFNNNDSLSLIFSLYIYIYILNLNWKIGKFYYMDFPIHSILCVFLRRPRFYLETLFRNFQVIDTIR